MNATQIKIRHFSKTVGGGRRGVGGKTIDGNVYLQTIEGRPPAFFAKVSNPHTVGPDCSDPESAIAAVVKLVVGRADLTWVPVMLLSMGDIKRDRVNNGGGIEDGTKLELSVSLHERAVDGEKMVYRDRSKAGRGNVHLLPFEIETGMSTSRFGSDDVTSIVEDGKDTTVAVKKLVEWVDLQRRILTALIHPINVQGTIARLMTKDGVEDILADPVGLKQIPERKEYHTWPTKSTKKKRS